MPTPLSFGSFFDIHAWAHSMAFLSMHMGSLTGVEGMSGRHVQPFVPFRSSTIMPPSACDQSRMVASFAITAGATLMALLILASLLFGALAAGRICPGA